MLLLLKYISPTFRQATHWHDIRLCRDIVSFILQLVWLVAPYQTHNASFFITSRNNPDILPVGNILKDWHFERNEPWYAKKNATSWVRKPASHGREIMGPINGFILRGPPIFLVDRSKRTIIPVFVLGQLPYYRVCLPGDFHWFSASLSPWCWENSR